MKKLDTDTVLEIIKMIDYRIKETSKALHIHKEYFTGKIDAYEELNNHLQDYIEGQLDATENQTEQ